MSDSDTLQKTVKYKVKVNFSFQKAIKILNVPTNRNEGGNFNKITSIYMINNRIRGK